MSERPTPETDKNALLLANLDDWIDDCLRNSKPIGLTLCDARKRISDQSDRIAELWDAMEIIRRERDEARAELAEAKREAENLAKSIYRYLEASDGYSSKREYDANGKEIYYENSEGVIKDNRPKTVEVTLEEIANKMGIKVEQLRIKE